MSPLIKKYIFIFKYITILFLRKLELIAIIMLFLRTTYVCQVSTESVHRCTIKHSLFFYPYERILFSNSNGDNFEVYPIQQKKIHWNWITQYKVMRGRISYQVKIQWVNNQSSSIFPPLRVDFFFNSNGTPLRYTLSNKKRIIEIG